MDDAEIVRRRLREREEALERAREFVRCVSEVLDVGGAWLFGSYARGDFNVWSDIDVLVVAEGLPPNPLRRLELVERCMGPGIEPVVVTPEEFERMRARRNPIAVEVERHGVPL